jgi:hypothetical protein
MNGAIQNATIGAINPMAGRAGQGGVEFGPTASGKLYLSLYYHRPPGNNAHKSKWHAQITPQDEYSIFDDSDTNNFQCAAGHYWGFKDDGKIVLGCEQEVLCKFPRNNNPAVPWHGFPVSPLGDGDGGSPDDAFVVRLRQEGRISKVFENRILRRKI